MPEQRLLGRRAFVANITAGLVSARAGPPAAIPGKTPDVESLLRSMSLEDRIGQLICGRMGVKEAEELAAGGQIGSAIGLLANLGSARAAAEYLSSLQRVARYPILFVGEQEHGSARNFAGGTEFPAYMAFGAARSKELAYLFGKINTIEARAVGYHWISCPTLDVNIEPSNPIINTRSLGEKPELVTELGLESCRGIVENRGLTCICHFPGHGATAGDSHVELPRVSRSRVELEAVELAPYRAGVRAGVMNCIMTAHNYYPAWEPEPNLPATLSRRIITGVLREGLGYQGLVATDSLSMAAITAHYPPGEAAVRAVQAGCDILLAYDVKPAIAGLKQAVESGTLPAARLDQSVRRVLQAKVWSGLFDRPGTLASVAQIVGCAEYRAAARNAARQAVTVLRNEGMPVSSSGKLTVISSARWGDLGPAQPQADDILRREISAKGGHPELIVLDEKGIDAPAVLAAVRGADAVVIAACTKIRSYSEESRRANGRLLSLVRDVAASGKHVSLLVLGDPYAVKNFPATQVCLCTYSNCADSIAAGVEALFGAKTGPGRLPVTISEEYRYGFGL